jgi:outer membrane cobalamin receptor
MVLGLALCVPTRAKADDVGELQGLLNEQVVTTASKQAEGTSSAPALSTNLSADDLRTYGIKTLAEAIDFLSVGVATSDDLNGGEIGARGVLLTGDRGSHFLLLVDGHAVNEQVRGSAWFGIGAGVPIELIDHIEVIVGPGSVLYGSNAMLGVINVVTKRAKDFAGLHLVAEETIPTTLRVAGAIGEKISIGSQEGDVTGEVEYVKQNGPSFYFFPENTGVDPFTGQPGRYSRAPTGTGIWGGAVAGNSLYAEAPSGIVRVALGKTELDLRASYYRHATPTGPGDFDDSATAEAEKRASADLKHEIAVSTLLQVSARAYADYYDLRGDFVASRGALCPFGFITCDYSNHARGVWGGLDLQTRWDWARSDELVTLAGVDVRQRSLKASADVVNIDTGRSLYPAIQGLDVTDTIGGAYLQQTWAPTRDLRFNGGIRGDRDPRFSIVLSPRIAVNWNAWKGSTFKAAYAEAFRAPSWDETNNATVRRIAADPLNPEKVRSVEASVQQRVGPHRVAVGTFYSTWTNLVGLQTLSTAETIQAIRDGKTSVPFTPGVQLTQYRNVSKVDNFGLNSSIGGTLGFQQFEYEATLTVARAQETENGDSKRLSLAPRIFGNARIAYTLGGALPTVAIAGHFLGDRLADHAIDGAFVPLPHAPPQLELRLCLSGTVPGLSHLSYRAIANYAFADRGPYVVGPVTSSIPTQPSPQLNPVDRFRTTLGLQYDL